MVNVETDAGITGIGEGGSQGHAGAVRRPADRPGSAAHRAALAGHVALVLLSAGTREEDALGALDLALWDIKGKALNLPVHALLGGMVRNYCECYNTAGMIPGIQPGMSLKERAQLTIAAGYRAFRMGAADAPGQHHLQHARARQSALRRLRAGARRRRQERRLLHRFPPALRSLGRRARLQSDRETWRPSSWKIRCAPKRSRKICRSCAAW